MSIADWLWATGWAWPVIGVCALVILFVGWCRSVQGRIYEDGRAARVRRKA